VYLDIVGRIPNYTETTQFIQDSNPNKRAKLIDMLLDSPGYNSNTFNYFAEMLRVKDRLEQDNLRVEFPTSTGCRIRSPKTVRGMRWFMTC
jgi:ribosome biogenesis GTPase A